MSEREDILALGLYRGKWKIAFVSDIEDLSLVLGNFNTFETPCFKWRTYQPENPSCKVFRVATLSSYAKTPVYEVVCSDDVITPLNVAHLFAYLCEESGGNDVGRVRMILVHFRGRPGREASELDLAFFRGEFET